MTTVSPGRDSHGFLSSAAAQEIVPRPAPTTRGGDGGPGVVIAHGFLWFSLWLGIPGRAAGTAPARFARIVSHAAASTRGVFSFKLTCCSGFLWFETSVSAIRAWSSPMRPTESSSAWSTPRNSTTRRLWRGETGVVGSAMPTRIRPLAEDLDFRRYERRTRASVVGKSGFSTFPRWRGKVSGRQNVIGVGPWGTVAQNSGSWPKKIRAPPASSAASLSSEAYICSRSCAKRGRRRSRKVRQK
jgi:hypothetical protein